MKTVNSSKWHTVRGVCAGILAACMLLSVCIGILPHTVLTTAASTTEEDRQSIKLMEETLAQLKQSSSSASNAYEEALAAYESAELDILAAYEAKEALDKDIIALQNEIDSTSALLAVYNEQVESYAHAIVEKEAEIERRHAQFRERIRVNYEESFTSYLHLVLASESFADLLYHLDVVASLLDYDKRMLSSLDGAKKDLLNMQSMYQTMQYKAQGILDDLTHRMPELEEKRAQSELLLAELDQKLIELSEKKDATEEEKRLLEEEMRKLEQKIDKEEAELEEKIRAEQERLRLEREEEERKRREEEAKQNQGSSSSSGEKKPVDDGTYIWPVPTKHSYISSYYGYRESPITGKQELHNGIDIPAPFGTDIYASRGGTVIISGWHYSYGNYVVIDHGEGMSTLYAHNSKLLVKVGDVVEQGHVIALCGNTGNSRGNHSHFCVRKDGKPLDPLDYVTRP